MNADDGRAYKLDKDGNPIELLTVPGNVAWTLCHDEAWQGCLTYDAFADRIVWTRPAPEVPGLAGPQPGEALADHHYTFVGQWLARNVMKFPDRAIEAGVEAAARQNTIHPVRDYLGALTWDGTPRVDNWLHVYLGADANENTADLGRMFLVSAVARVERPGAQADHMLILEGTQGVGKSSAAKILGGRWFLEGVSDLSTKDAMADLAGNWIVELSELDAFRAKDWGQIKGYLTKRADKYRPAYGHRWVERPRQCVFIGTTNQDAPLSDATGGRRFWPVHVVGLDRAALERDRDQLWAEARVLYEQGVPWWPTTAEQAGRIAEIQEDAYQGDPWEPLIAVYLFGRGSRVFMEDLLEHLGLPVDRWGKSEQTRVGAIMRRLHWRKCRPLVKGARRTAYDPPAHVIHLVSEQVGEAKHESSHVSVTPDPPARSRVCVEGEVDREDQSADPGGWVDQVDHREPGDDADAELFGSVLS